MPKVHFGVRETGPACNASTHGAGPVYLSAELHKVTCVTCRRKAIPQPRPAPPVSSLDGLLNMIRENLGDGRDFNDEGAAHSDAWAGFDMITCTMLTAMVEHEWSTNRVRRDITYSRKDVGNIAGYYNREYFDWLVRYRFFENRGKGQYSVTAKAHLIGHLLETYAPLMCDYVGLVKEDAPASTADAQATAVPIVAAVLRLLAAYLAGDCRCLPPAAEFHVYSDAT